MCRWVTSAAVIATLSTWVGAQAPAKPGPEETAQLELMRRDRVLLDRLVNSSVEISGLHDPLARLESGDGVFRRLVADIHLAAENRDTDRVKEMTQHLRAMMDNAVLPNLHDARERVPPQSQDEKRLFKRADAVNNSLEGIAKLAEDLPPEFAELFDGLDATRDKVTASTRHD